LSKLTLVFLGNKAKKDAKTSKIKTTATPTKSAELFFPAFSALALSFTCFFALISLIFLSVSVSTFSFNSDAF